jgi:hypothetical protein
VVNGTVARGGAFLPELATLSVFDEEKQNNELQSFERCKSVFCKYTPPFVLFYFAINTSSESSLAAIRYPSVKCKGKEGRYILVYFFP